MNTLVAMQVLTDRTGTYAVIVIGDREGTPRLALISYGQRPALDAVAGLSIPQTERENATSRILEALSSEPNARAIEFAGVSEAGFAQCVAAGLGAYAKEISIDASEDWDACIPRFRSFARENLTFVSVSDPTGGRFLAALVEDRDDLPRRYRAVAARLYDEGAPADGVEIDRDVIVLPETFATVYATGWALLSQASGNAAPRIRTVVCLPDGSRQVCVILYGVGDGEPSGLRWTHSARRAREWVSGTSGLLAVDVAAVVERLSSLAEEDDGPSPSLSGEVGAEVARAFLAGHDMLTQGVRYAVVPVMILRDGVTVNGRKRMMLAIHAEKDSPRYRAALLEKNQALYSFYMANADRVHETNESLGSGVRNELIVPIPDVLTLAIVTGLAGLHEDEPNESN